MQPPVAEDLVLGSELMFDRPILEGGRVVFYSTSVDLVRDSEHVMDGTAVDLLSTDKDILLHVCIRCAQNTIVFNSKPRGGAWQNEEHVPLPGIFTRSDATVVIRLQGSEWLVLVDGRPIKALQQRINRPAVAIAYSADIGRRPVFSMLLYVALAAASVA